MFPKPYADLAQRLRVPAGFVLVAAFAWLSAPTPASLAAGLPIGVAGLALRAWAAGHLAKNEQLAVSGPYAHLRNPLYAGTLLVGIGFTISAARPLLAALLVAAFLAIYLPSIQLEEEHLAKLFPAWTDYASRVPSILPRLGADRGASQFRWDLYARNREIQAAFGFLAGALVLAGKAWWR